MSCSVCNGHPGCPCCTPEPIMVDCPTCGGIGYFYHAYDIENDTEVECTEAAYECLPLTEEAARATNQRYCRGEKEVCEVCDGAGEVEYEPDYEPDYD